MTIGEKNRLVKFYKPSTTLDAENNPTGWVLHKSKWADIKSETGMGRIRSEASAGGINTDLRKYSFRVTYDLSLDLTMRVEFHGVMMDVVTLLHDHAGRMYTDVVAEQGGNNG